MFWKLFAVCALLTALALGFLGSWDASRARDHAITETQALLDRVALLLAEAWRHWHDARNPDELQARVVRLARETGIRMTLIAEEGRVLADSDEDPARMENHARRPEVRQALARGYGTARRHSSTLGEEMMYVARSVPAGPDADRPGAPRLGIARTSLSLAAVEAQAASLRRMTWIVVALTTLAVLAAAYYFTRRYVGPLQDLTASVQAFRLQGSTAGLNLPAAPASEVRQLAGAFREMAERLVFEITRAESERDRIQSVLEGMIEGVVAIDPEGRIVLANRAAYALLGLEPALTDAKVWELVRSPELNEAVDALLAGRPSISTEIALPSVLERRGGDWSARARRLAVHGVRLGGQSTSGASPLPSRAAAADQAFEPGAAPRRQEHERTPRPRGDRATHGAVLVFHDVTDLRRLERMRQEFVANVTHELKTPLTSIRAHTETLLAGAIDDAEHRRRFLHTIDEQAAHLERLIQDMLDLSRLESGAVKLRADPVRLDEVCRSSAERHRARAAARGHELLVEGPEQVVVQADHEGIEHVLDNLLSNALQYTDPPGRVTVRWRVEDGGGVIEVSDTGIGIPAAHQSRVFERFYRVDRARSREAGGTGLGLAIVKHLVQAMGGSVSVRSQVGAGSTFSVWLPLAAPSSVAHE